MLTKNFSTTTVDTNACWFRRDYSYRTNPTTCLGCEFCYKRLDTQYPERRRSASYIDTNEKFHSKTIFKTPVIISRFCEPFVDGQSTEASLLVAEKCIVNDCQFIFKTALDLPSRAVELLENNKENSQCQLRFISGSGEYGDWMTRSLSPKYNLAKDQLVQGANLVLSGIDVVALFDPFIIGVNEIQCKGLIKDLAESGIKKIIIKQLFATDNFVRFLNVRIGRRYTNLLKNNTYGYWTYDTMLFLNYLYPILEECAKYEVSLTVCSNREANELVYGDGNCCQFNNPIGFYNKEGKIINE